MPAPENPTYKVAHLHHVPRQITDALGSVESREGAFVALQAIADHLETNPADWGDPGYRTAKEGGTVFHAICMPFVVRYAVYEQEKAVCILDIKLVRGQGS